MSNMSNSKSKLVKSYLSTADEMKDFLENKLKPVEGLFCISNYYRNNFSLPGQEQAEALNLTLPKQSQRSVSSAVKREAFKLGDLLPH